MLTLAAVRASLWKYASSVVYGSATNDDKAAFDAILNQVRERFINAGYSDTQLASITAYPDVNGNAVITLPRDLKSLIGTVNQTDTCTGPPLTVRGNWYEYIPTNGRLPACDCGNAIAVPGRFCVYREWTEPSRLLFSCGPGDTAGVIHIYGTSDGVPVVSDDGEGNMIPGEYVTISEGGALTESTFDAANLRIVKPVTLGGVTLALYPLGTTVAYYEQSETVPNYKRYKVPATETVETMSDPAGTYLVIAKREFVPLANDDDPVEYSLGALKLGLISLQFEDKNDPERAMLYMGPNWPERTGRMAGAKDLLDEERAESQVAEVPGFATNGFGAGNVPHVR